MLNVHPYIIHPVTSHVNFVGDALHDIIHKIHNIGKCECTCCKDTKMPSAKVLPAVAVTPGIKGIHFINS